MGSGSLEAQLSRRGLCEQTLLLTPAGWRHVHRPRTESKPQRPGCRERPPFSVSPAHGPSRAASHLPAPSLGSAPAGARRGQAAPGGVRPALQRRRGFRAEALLLHHHCGRRCRRQVPVPVPSPTPPFPPPLAFDLLHAAIPRSRAETDPLSPSG